MNSLQRLQSAANFEPYDRPPFADNEWNDGLVEIVPHFSGCPVRGDRRYSQAERAAAVRATLDMLPWSAIYDHPRCPVLGDMPQRVDGQRVLDEDGFAWIIRSQTEWVERRPFSDLAGFVAYLDRKSAQFRAEPPSLSAVTPQWGSAHREAVERGRMGADGSPDFEARLRAARRALGEVVIAIPYMGFGLDDLYRLAGWDLFASAVCEAPEAIAVYLDALADRNIRLILQYARVLPASQSPVALVYSDIACNTGLLVSPRFLRLALFPAVRKVCAAYHQHGIKVVYHSEGNLRKILDELIETGVDGINPLSPSEGMDAVEIRRLYPRLILWGGIDERAVLACGRSAADIRREVERVVAGVGCGLILGSSGGVHPGCSANDLIAMIEALRGIPLAHAIPQRRFNSVKQVHQKEEI